MAKRVGPLVPAGFMPALLIGQQRSPASGLAAQFVGTWRLVAYEQRRSSGEVVYPRGRNPQGVIIYDANGRMAVQIMNTDRGRAASNPLSDTEAQAAYRSYTAYYGTYTIDEAARTVTHHVEGSLNPNTVGSKLTRSFELSGDRITLTPPPTTVGGEQRVTRLTWERVRQP
jgi:hypothetical protein